MNNERSRVLSTQSDLLRQISRAMPGWSKVMTQTKRDTVVLQVGVLGLGHTTPLCRTWICFETSTEDSESRSGGRSLGRPWPENEPKRRRSHHVSKVRISCDIIPNEKEANVLDYVLISLG
jgi:hypothetical protein